MKRVAAACILAVGLCLARPLSAKEAGSSLVPAAASASPRLAWPLAWHLGGPEAFAAPGLLQVIGHPAAGRDADGAFEAFDGRSDGFVVAANPLEGRAHFSIEAVIRPDPSGPAAQRFMYIQDAAGRRVTMEIRLSADGRWALDTFLLDGKSKHTLRDTSLLHPAGSWHRVGLRYDGRTLRSFVDGRAELTGDVLFNPMTGGRTAIGVRLDRRSWYKGAIREIRFGDAP